MLTISFHSVKGGAGATTTLLNTLSYLGKDLNVTSKNPILVIDSDLSTSSLTYLLNLDQRFSQSYDVKSLFEGVLPGKNVVGDLSTHPFISKCVKLGNVFNLEDDSVYFLGIDDIKDFDLGDSARSIDKVIYELKRLCRGLGFSAVIFDLEAGDDLISNLIMRNSKVIVMPLRVSSESIISSSRFLERFESAMIDPDTDEQLRSLIVLPNFTPKVDDMFNGINLFTESLQLLEDRLDNIKFLINRTFINSKVFGIEELTRLKWFEGILHEGLNDLSSDEKKALERYKLLAKTIIIEGRNDS